MPRAARGECAEWYEINCRANLKDVKGNPPTIRADVTPRGVHFADFRPYCVASVLAGSERFKKFVEVTGLTGLEFYWLRDAGLEVSPQWFLINAIKPLGRGVDHPWFDPAKGLLKFEDEFHGGHYGGTDFFIDEPMWRFGIVGFGARRMRDGWQHPNPAANRLLQIVKSKDREDRETKFASYPRVLRKYLPDTDFAFLWREKDAPFPEWQGEQPRDGYLSRWVRSRRLCVRGTVAKQLVEARLISRKSLSPIAVLDEVPEGSAVLDGHGPLPPPMVTAAEAKIYHRDFPAAWAKHLREVKEAEEATPRDLEGELDRLRAWAEKAKSYAFESPASEEAIDAVEEEMGRLIPTAWRRVLEVADGFEWLEFGVTSTSQLVEEQEHCNGWLQDKSEAVRRKYLHVASTGNGDWYSLVVSGKNRVEDCAVVMWDHETQEICERWGSVAEMLAARLDDAERDKE